MNRWPDINYLRWARAQAEPPHPEIGLVFSGMGPPDPSWLGGFDTADLLAYAVGDHPPIAHSLAQEWSIAPERVLVQPGSHLSIQLLLAARLGQVPGPVVVEEPTYEPLWRIPEALGAEVLRWLRPRSTGHALDPDAIDRLAGAKPSVILLSHPHNPSGTMLGEADIEAIARLQDRTGCALISDEVYLEFCEEPQARTLLDRLDRTAIIRSFTKVFGLGSLRCSAMAGPRDWINRSAALSDHASVAVSGPSQAVARRAWDRRHDLWQRARDAAAAGRAEVAPWIEAQSDRLDATVPDSGIICFPRLDEATHAAAVAMARRHGVEGPFGYGLDSFPDGSEVWIEDLRRRRGVQLTPGSFFGDPHAFRIGFGTDPETVRIGLTRLQEHLDEARDSAANGFKENR